MMTASTSTLMPEDTTLPKHALGHEGGLAEQAEGDQHEAGERGQLELDQRDEKLDGEDEEGEHDQRPGEQQARDLDEVLEEGDPAHQVGNGFEQRPAGVEAGLRHAAGTHQIFDGKAGARRHEAEAGEAVEDDAREVVPVGDDVGEDADEQGLLHQPRDDVVIRAPGPEQRGERHVDDDQRGGDEGDLAAEQAEPAVDVAR